MVKDTDTSRAKSYRTNPGWLFTLFVAFFAFVVLLMNVIMFSVVIRGKYAFTRPVWITFLTFNTIILIPVMVMTVYAFIGISYIVAGEYPKNNPLFALYQTCTTDERLAKAVEQSYKDTGMWNESAI